jgi:murein DD-endopeptidase MepM/ murein hydrolase activator NlpD
VRRVPALLCGGLLLLSPGAVLFGQSAFKYQDASGHWIFTDEGSGKPALAQSLNLPRESAAFSISVKRVDAAGKTRLLAVNHCLCVARVLAQIDRSTLADVRSGARYTAVLDPGEARALLEVPAGVPGADVLRFRWSASLGSPEAQHHPPRPYRAPFALGAAFMVTQAYPTHITHVTPDSRYAVDFALPDGTPVYAAREGTIIDLRHDAFIGALDPTLLDQANVIEILHDDGTIAVYAHLHWDSIRVHVGQKVRLGEYIADSGNTGFTSGPHLHFAVWRNSPVGEIAVPVVFAGPGGSPVTAETAAALTAY